ncbi:MAG TPA: PQQ-dependent sugar dehydrogenase [Gaiellaceae bacterium]|nr:PQQ-dependent sugar dehydrogenase [Gaiellaceae bacterium]
MRRQAVLVLLLLLVLSLVWPAPGSAVRLRLVADGFDALTLATAPRSGDPGGTLYVVEQEGQIWKRRDGVRRLFLDIRNIVSCCGERGLLGLAFDPGYATNDLVYVNFTNNRGDTRIVRYRTNDAHTRVLEGTRRTLLRLDQPDSNHNGGRLAFGPNGRLYTGTGDGGGSCDPAGRAQNLRSRLGKLLSIDPRALDRGWRIEGYGLRNPWGVSFDRKTGRLYVADVGQSRREEVNTRSQSRLGGTRENYLWDVYEGRERGTCTHGGLRGGGTRVFPISVYSHSVGCSITGGHAYRGRALASQGWYYFGDYCTGRIWRLLVRDGKLVRGRRLALDTEHNITSFGESRRGELFLTTRDGEVFRLVRS